MRRATADDADAIAYVHRLSRAWYYGTEPDPDDGREQLWSRLLAQPGRTTYVATTADGTVGFVSWLRPVPDEQQDEQRDEQQDEQQDEGAEEVGEVELTALYLLPERAGTGLGDDLHRIYEEHRGDQPGRLEVWEGNERAIGFYRRRGWRPTEESRSGPRGAGFRTYRLSPGSPD